jgi:hypothetical protein
MNKVLVVSTVVLTLAGCNGGDTQSNVRAPGAQTSARTQVLEAGAAALQTQLQGADEREARRRARVRLRHSAFDAVT